MNNRLLLSVLLSGWALSAPGAEPMVTIFEDGFGELPTVSLPGWSHDKPDTHGKK